MSVVFPRSRSLSPGKSLRSAVSSKCRRHIANLPEWRNPSADPIRRGPTHSIDLSIFSSTPAEKVGAQDGLEAIGLICHVFIQQVEGRILVSKRTRRNIMRFASGPSARLAFETSRLISLS